MFTMCNCFGDDRRRFDYEIGHENLEGRVLFPNSSTAHPDYFVQIPTGSPAGCNPINAPDWCTPQDIENPEFLTRKP